MPEELFRHSTSILRTALNNADTKQSHIQINKEEVQALLDSVDSIRIELETVKEELRAAEELISTLYAPPADK